MGHCEKHGTVVKNVWGKCEACLFEEPFLTAEQWKEEAAKSSAAGNFTEAFLCRQAYMGMKYNNFFGRDKRQFQWGDYLTEVATGKPCRMVGDSTSYGPGGVMTKYSVSCWFLERNKEGALYLMTRHLSEHELEKREHHNDPR